MDAKKIYIMCSAYLACFLYTRGIYAQMDYGTNESGMQDIFYLFGR